MLLLPSFLLIISSSFYFLFMANKIPACYLFLPKLDPFLIFFIDWVRESPLRLLFDRLFSKYVSLFTYGKVVLASGK